MKNPIFSEESLKKLSNSLNNSDQKILILGHKSPDGDAVGSCLALKHYLNILGYDAKVILPDAFPSFLNWMKGKEEILIFEKEWKTCIDLIYNAKLIFTLDFNDQSRVGEKMGHYLSKSPAKKIMIDHHQDPKDYAYITYSDVQSCSTAQLIYELIEANNDLDKINEDIASCIYTGIIMDSGSFRFSSTTPKTHRIAGELIEKGLNQTEIHQRVYDVNTTDRLKLLGYALNEKLEINNEVGVALISLTTEEMNRYNTKKGYTEGFVNYALSVEGIKIAVFIKEDTNLVKISFRSKGDIPVNKFARTFFEGGGHINAAGGKSNLSVLDAVNEVKSKIYEFAKKY